MSSRYKILERLGHGGAGSVHKAWDDRLSRYVAIKKLLPPEQREADGVGTDLRKEASMLSSLQHPNVVAVFDIDDIEGDLCVVMEFLNGETLDATVQRGALTVRDFVSVASQTMEGLVAAHRLGVIHRDIKPGNIMVNWMPNGDFLVKMLDFGLAEFTRRSVPRPEEAADRTYGSVHFMAPEQLRTGRAEARSDLYALGCVYYYVLTGTYPFNGDTVGAITNAHLEHRLIPLGSLRPDLPGPVQKWIEHLMQPDLENRPSSADAALAQWQVILAGQAKSATKTVTPGPARHVAATVRPPVPTGRVQPVPRNAPRSGAVPRVTSQVPKQKKPKTTARKPSSGRKLLKPWMLWTGVALLGLLLWLIFAPSDQTASSGAVDRKPSGVPVSGPGLLLHLDASRADTLKQDATRHVSRWEDAEGSGNFAEQVLAAKAPVLTPNLQNFLPMIDFGPMQMNLDGRFMELLNASQQKLKLKTIRTVFWVIKGANHLLSDEENCDFHRGESDAPFLAPMWDARFAGPGVFQGQTRLNGAQIDGTKTAAPNGCFLLSLITTVPVQAGNLCKDRNLRTGGQQIGEILIYDRALSDEERLATEAYLYKKWFGVPLPK